MTFATVREGKLGEEWVSPDLAHEVHAAWAAIEASGDLRHTRHLRNRKALGLIRRLGLDRLYCWDGGSSLPVVQTTFAALASHLEQAAFEGEIRGISVDGCWLFSAERGQDATRIYLWEVPAVGADETT